MLPSKLFVSDPPVSPPSLEPSQIQKDIINKIYIHTPVVRIYFVEVYYYCIILKYSNNVFMCLRSYTIIHTYVRTFVCRNRHWLLIALLAGQVSRIPGVDP